MLGHRRTVHPYCSGVAIGINKGEMGEVDWFTSARVGDKICYTCVRFLDSRACRGVGGCEVVAKLPESMFGPRFLAAVSSTHDGMDNNNNSDVVVIKDDSLVWVRSIASIIDRMRPRSPNEFSAIRPIHTREDGLLLGGSGQVNSRTTLTALGTNASRSLPRFSNSRTR